MPTTELAKQTQTIEAVYENGVFRPLQPLNEEVKEGEKVRLRLYTINAALQALNALTHIYDGLSEEEIAQVEKAILRRSNNSDPLEGMEGPSEVRQAS